MGHDRDDYKKRFPWCIMNKRTGGMEKRHKKPLLLPLRIQFMRRNPRGKLLRRGGAVPKCPLLRREIRPFFSKRRAREQAAERKRNFYEDFVFIKVANLLTKQRKEYPYVIFTTHLWNSLDYQQSKTSHLDIWRSNSYGNYRIYFFLILQIYLSKLRELCWRDGSAIKKPGCSSRGSSYHFQHPHGDSNDLWLQFQGIQLSLVTTLGTRHAGVIHAGICRITHIFIT